MAPSTRHLDVAYGAEPCECAINYPHDERSRPTGHRRGADRHGVPSGRLPSSDPLDAARSADTRANGRAVGSSRRRLAISSGASAASRLAPDPTATYKVIEVKRSGFSRGYDRRSGRIGASGARSCRRKRRPRSSHHGFSGASATISRRSTTSGNGTPRRRRHRTRSCRRGSAKRSRTLHGLDDTAPGRTYENPFVGTRELNGLLVLAGDAGQLRSEGRAERALHAEEASSRGRPAGTSRAISGSPSAAPACSTRRAATSRSSRRRRSSRASPTASVRFDYRGRHGALVDDITPADVRWICETLQRLDRHAVARRVPRRRLCAGSGEPVHPAVQAEDRRRAGTRTMNVRIAADAALP